MADDRLRAPERLFHETDSGLLDEVGCPGVTSARCLCVLLRLNRTFIGSGFCAEAAIFIPECNFRKTPCFSEDLVDRRLQACDADMLSKCRLGRKYS